MSKTRRVLSVLAVTVLVAGAAAFITWCFRSPWLVARGADWQQRCASLVDTIALTSRDVSQSELFAELERRGVKIPSLPVYPQTGGSPRELQQWLRAYAVVRKEYDTRWDELQRSSDYESARAAVLERNRAGTLKACARIHGHS